MIVAFCKVNCGSKIGYVVDALTGFGGFYHCELVMDDGEMLTSLPEDGVKWRRRPEGYPADSWVLINLGDADEDRIRDWAENEIGCCYDYWGDLMLALRMPRATKDCWFCSELVTAAIQEAGFGVGLTPCAMSPNRLHEALIERGYRMTR